MMARALGMEVTGVLKPAARTVRLTFQCEAPDITDLRLALYDRLPGSQIIVTVDACATETRLFDNNDIPFISPVDTKTALKSASTSTTSTRARVTAAADGCIAANSRFYKRLTGTTVDTPFGLRPWRYGPLRQGSERQRVRRAPAQGLRHRVHQVSAAYRPEMEILTAGFCGGSAPTSPPMPSGGAPTYVCGDIRYHDFSSAMQQGQVICDVGHFESEICAKMIFHNILSKKNLVTLQSIYRGRTNPILYL